MSTTLSVGRLFERLKDILEIEPIGDASGFDRPVTSPEVSSPGLELHDHHPVHPVRGDIERGTIVALMRQDIQRIAVHRLS